MRQDGLDVSEIDTESDRASAFPRPLLSELDEPCAIELRKSQPPQPFLEKVEARRPGSPDGLSYLLKVFAMQGDQIAESPGLARASRQRRVAAVDSSLDIERPLFGVLPAKERLVDIFSFPPHLNAPGTGTQLCERRQSVCAPCALSRRTAAYWVA